MTQGTPLQLCCYSVNNAVWIFVFNSYLLFSVICSSNLIKRRHDLELLEIGSVLNFLHVDSSPFTFYDSVYKWLSPIREDINLRRDIGDINREYNKRKRYYPKQEHFVRGVVCGDEFFHMIDAKWQQKV